MLQRTSGVAEDLRLWRENGARLRSFLLLLLLSGTMLLLKLLSDLLGLKTGVALRLLLCANRAWRVRNLRSGRSRLSACGRRRTSRRL